MSSDGEAESPERSEADHKQASPQHGPGAVCEQEASTVHSPATASNKKGVVDLRKLNTEQLRCIKPSNNTLHPFAGLDIQDSSFLDEIDDRSACVQCSKSRKYFCYTCYVPLPCIAERIPSLKLPFKIDIIRHPREIAGKSTAVHAAVLCPEDVAIHTHPALPDYSICNDDDVVLIFPHKGAVGVEELLRPLHPPSQKRPRPHLPFTKAVFIDCTWNQTRRIYCDERVRDMRCVELSQHETLFWRYQRGKPKTYLATIEAIYYFLVEVHKATATTPYQGQYDNLLFFFKFMFEKIHSQYDPDCLRAYKDL